MLGKHSGRHALKQRCEDLGFDAHAKKNSMPSTSASPPLADRKKGLMNEEIAGIVRRSQRRSSRQRPPTNHMNLNVLDRAGRRHRHGSHARSRAGARARLRRSSNTS